MIYITKEEECLLHTCEIPKVQQNDLNYDLLGPHALGSPAYLGCPNTLAQ